MPIYIVPTYRDFFSGAVPEPKDLLQDIPSDLVLNVIAFINAQIMLGPNTLEYHKHIFNLLTKNLERSFPDIVRRLDFFTRKKEVEVRIFGTPYLLDFMQYELQFYRDVPDFKDTNPDQSIRIIKAYFVFVERAQERIHTKTKAIEYDRSDKFWFQRRTWPLVIEQYEINNSHHPGVFAIKAFAFFQYFNEHPVFKKYVQGFLESTKQQSIANYVIRLMNIVMLSFSKPNDKNIYHYKIANFEPEFQSLLDHLSTNPEKFKAVPNHSKNYNGIRSNPIFNFRDEGYVVLNWQFLYQKLYKGLIFDFYNRSGIKSEFTKLPDYFAMIANQITEYRFFQPVIRHLLEKKHTVLEFDVKEENRDAKPDLYYRDRNQILLAELKDITLPAETITEYSFESLVSQLEKKLVKNEKGAHKGILQLLNHIKAINEGEIAYDLFEKRGIKKPKLKIFPVIIYTNFEYSLPGIEDYLRKRFKEELKAYQSQADAWKLGEVHELVMIDFDFMLHVLVGGEKNNWFDLIRDYNKKLSRYLKQFNKSPSVELSVKLFPGFSWVHQDLGANRALDIETLFQVLGVEITPDVLVSSKPSRRF